MATTTLKPLWIPSPYQQADVDAFVNLEYGALFNEMGLGKTSTILEIFRILKERGVVRNMIVITAQKIAAATWPAEIKKWRQFEQFRHILLHGPFKVECAKMDVDIYLCPFESLAWLPAVKEDFDMIVVDESDKIKDMSSFRTKVCWYLGERAKRRYIMSGTPAAEGIEGLYSQYKFLDGGKALGDTFALFKGRYLAQHKYNKYKLVGINGAKEKIAELTGAFTRRTTLEEAGIEMPPISFETIRVELPDDARVKYDEFEATMFMQLTDTQSVISANAAVLSNQCRQIANGALYDEDHNWHPIHNAKLDALQRLYDTEIPLVVCYEYLHDKERILARFGQVPVIGGGTKPEDLKGIVDGWNAGRHRMILLHPKSAAHGLNLQGIAAHVVFFSLPWSLGDTKQLVARLWRRGQIYAVKVWRLLAGDTVDEIVEERVGEKDAGQEELFDLLRSYARRRLEQLDL
jgi:SNF2 family DNA or RNA helicase